MSARDDQASPPAAWLEFYDRLEREAAQPPCGDCGGTATPGECLRCDEVDHG